MKRCEDMSEDSPLRMELVIRMGTKDSARRSASDSASKASESCYFHTVGAALTRTIEKGSEVESAVVKALQLEYQNSQVLAIAVSEESAAEIVRNHASVQDTGGMLAQLAGMSSPFLVAIARNKTRMTQIGLVDVDETSGRISHATDLIQVKSMSAALSHIMEQHSQTGAEQCVADAKEHERFVAARHSEREGGLIRIKKDFRSPKEVARWGRTLQALGSLINSD